MSERVVRRDAHPVQPLNEAVSVGKFFVFLEPSLFETSEFAWLRQVPGLELPTFGTVISRLRGVPVHVPGLVLDPVVLPALNLGSVTCDRDLYRHGEDSVRLLVVDPQRAGSNVKLEVLLQGACLSNQGVTLSRQGAGVLELSDLTPGTYEVRLAGQTSGCCFVVAEYRLAPLTATLAERHRQGEQLHFLLRVESFGVPVEGRVRVDLMEEDRRRQSLTLDACEGLVRGAFPLQGEGAHSLVVQRLDQPAHTASVALTGTRASERSETLFSTLGQEVTGSLLPEAGAIAVRGLFLSEGASRNSPLRLERVDAARARLTAVTDCRSVLVVALDPCRSESDPRHRPTPPNLDGDSAFWAGMRHYQQTRYPEAFEQFSRSLQENEEAWTAHYMARCKCLQGELDEAMRLVERTLALGWGNRESLLSLPDLADLRRHPDWEALALPRARETFRAELKAGESIEVEADLPLGLLAVGCYADGQPFEGWAAVVPPPRLEVELKAPATAEPGARVTVEVLAPEGSPVYLLVRDLRLTRQDTPESRLAAGLKRWVEGVQAAPRSSTGFQGTSTVPVPRRSLGSSVPPALSPRPRPEPGLRRGMTAARAGLRRSVLGADKPVLEHHAEAVPSYGVRPGGLPGAAAGFGASEPEPAWAAESGAWAPAEQVWASSGTAQSRTSGEVVEQAWSQPALEQQRAQPASAEQQWAQPPSAEQQWAPPPSAEQQWVPPPSAEQSWVPDPESSGPSAPDALSLDGPGADRPERSHGNVGQGIPGEEARPTENGHPDGARPNTPSHVLYAGLLEGRDGRFSVDLDLPECMTDYRVEAFVLAGRDWVSRERRLRVTSSLHLDLEVPTFVFPGDRVEGRAFLWSTSGRATLQVEVDGRPLELEAVSRRGFLTTFRFPVEPGEYRALALEPSNGNCAAAPPTSAAEGADAESRPPGAAEERSRTEGDSAKKGAAEDGSSTAGSSLPTAGMLRRELCLRVEQPGKLRRFSRGLRLLRAGETLARSGAVTRLRVLPGCRRPLETLAEATAGYEHLCCEQTSSKMLAAAFMLELATDPARRSRAESILAAGLERLHGMWHPQRGFRMYPGQDSFSDHYGRMAASNLRVVLHLLSHNPASNRLSLALGRCRELLNSACQHYQLRVPEHPETTEEAYWHLALTGGDTQRALSCVRSFLSQPGAAGSRVWQRVAECYAAAVLVRCGELEEALPLANQIAGQLNEEGRLYSTADSVAALAMFRELDAQGMLSGTARVQVDDRVLETTACGAEDCAQVLVLEGVAAVEVDQVVEEDWGAFSSRVPLRVSLESGGRVGRRFRPGDPVDLRVRLEQGYTMGDLVWVCLPACLTRVIGGGQVKRFAVDFKGHDEVVVPLVASSASGGQAQRFALCVRNMYDEDRTGSPGMLEVLVD